MVSMIPMKKMTIRVPKWLFFPVWMILYSLLTVSIFLYYDNNNLYTRQFFVVVVTIFFINLLLNKLWSMIFFGLKWFQAAAASRSL